ncbi:MAG: 4-(cytidine 5'-diphospho)-2-C-methyl-D-erythritol kinase IspE [Rhodobacteraceae bacterium HLUCCA08]|nr:MAG: 4-(cytidine 5'-diphospho)-2-C-methyl-D-erythritol kinase IspE [Rhodobacteraceae bacterium HLUCCA08]
MTADTAPVTETAPAKINLCLHVTGQRADGYHRLDSLVCFTGLGDRVTVRPAKGLSLRITGPFAAGLSAEDNLVLRAARLFGSDRGAAITLDKVLPVASGIGGGSADAAATLRALSRLWGLPRPDDVLSLGADVPVCLSPELQRMQGVGEVLTPLGPAPMLDMLLVNPGVTLATPRVFAGLARRDNAPLGPDMPDPFDTAAWIGWLAEQRNDLEAPALKLAPEIGTVLAALRAQDGCLLARMSGSGATCFALFADDAARDAAGAALRAQYPGWWVAETDEAPV